MTISPPRAAWAPYILAQSPSPTASPAASPVAVPSISPSPSPSPTVRPFEIWSSPVVGSVMGALVAAIIGGGVVKLWWDLKAMESRALEADKKTEIAELTSKHSAEIQEKISELRQKELEIKELNAEIARLKLETPASLKEGYVSLRESVSTLYEGTQDKLDKTNATLLEKEAELLNLKNQEKDHTDLIKKLESEKQELLEKQRIFQDIIGALKSFSDRIKALQAVRLWIDINQKELVDSSTHYVISDFPQLLGLSQGEENEKLIARFRDNLDDYVDWIKFSLDKGEPVNLSKIKLQPEVPGAALAKAFEFIKKQRAARELSDDLADELGAFISDLTAYFSSPAFRL